MNNESNINNIDNQSELVKIRNIAQLDSEEYQRAKDKIRDIQLDTNNKQTGAFSDFVKEYRIQSDKLSKYILILTAVTVIMGMVSLLLQVINLNLSSNSKVEVIQVDTRK